MGVEGLIADIPEAKQEEIDDKRVEEHSRNGAKLRAVFVDELPAGAQKGFEFAYHSFHSNS